MSQQLMKTGFHGKMYIDRKVKKMPQMPGLGSAISRIPRIRARTDC